MVMMALNKLWLHIARNLREVEVTQSFRDSISRIGYLPYYFPSGTNKASGY